MEVPTKPDFALENTGSAEGQTLLTVTDAAKNKIASVLATQDPPVHALRISSPFRGKYSMNLEPEGKPDLDDTVLHFEGFDVYIDPASVSLVEGATVDWVETFGGGGFQFTNPNDKPKRPEPKPVPEGAEGDRWRRIQEVLDEEINPAVAGHGGYISLIDVQGDTVFVEMGGGCQGCAMSRMTLKQGVERVLKTHFPEIDEILDVTDHAGGRNPYYTAS